MATYGFTIDKATHDKYIKLTHLYEVSPYWFADQMRDKLNELINELVVAALALIVVGSLLYIFPISNGFGCAHYTGNVCTTTTQESQANNIAIFGYYTLISAVLAIFIDTMRSEDSATPLPA